MNLPGIMEENDPLFPNGIYARVRRRRQTAGKMLWMCAFSNVATAAPHHGGHLGIGITCSNTCRTTT